MCCASVTPSCVAAAVDTSTSCCSVVAKAPGAAVVSAAWDTFSILAADVIGPDRRTASASCGWVPAGFAVHAYMCRSRCCCPTLCCVLGVCGCRAHGWCAHGAAGPLPGWRKHLRPHGHVQGHHQHRWGAGNTHVALTHVCGCAGVQCASTRLCTSWCHALYAALG